MNHRPSALLALVRYLSGRHDCRHPLRWEDQTAQQRYLNGVVNGFQLGMTFSMFTTYCVYFVWRFG